MQPIHIESIEAASGYGLLAAFADKLGAYQGRDVGAKFGLQKMGVHVETLAPGSLSALRHWHEDSDELVYIIAGQLTLICDDGESTLTPGMVVGFPAGLENGHHLKNQSENPATFLVVGTRSPKDKVHYPDDDLTWLNQDGQWIAAHKDGTPYEGGH